MILLQINPTFDDELKTICKGCYKNENIFAWFSILSTGHYH